MDDRSFDDFIKGRLDGYEDPSFDPAALEGFHGKLATFRPMPWYEHHVSQYMMAASIALFTVVNAYLFWPEKKVVTESHTSENNTHQTIIDSLTVVIEELKVQSQVERNMRDSISENYNAALVVAAATPHAQQKDGGLYLGRTSEIPPDLFHALIVKRMVMTDQGGAYLITPVKGSESFASASELSLTEVGETYPWPVAGLSDPEMKSLNEPETIIPEHKRAISSKMRRDIEKHYSKGIGINLGLHADLAKNVFSNAGGGTTPKLGVVADWVLSPSLSVETGIDYSTTVAKISENFQDYDLPLPDGSLGVVEKFQVKNSLLSAPVAVKYRQWVSEKSQAFVKLGYTPYYTFQQNYEYTYDLDRRPDPNPGSGPGPGPGPGHHPVTSIEQKNEKYFYGNTATASIGLTHMMTAKNKLEASLFYEQSLSPVGQQQLGLQLFGLRAGYWFNLR